MSSTPPEQEPTTALPRPAGTPGAADYQETTVLRRPASPPAPSNVPGSQRGREPLPPYTPPRIPRYDVPAGPDPAGDHPPTGDDGGGYGAGGDRAGGYDPGYGADRATPGGRSRTGGQAAAPRGLSRPPRKLTVTRVAALRSKELTHRGLEKFHGAVSADGADLSGLGHLTYAVMGNYAVDAALAVALANTLFFAAATAESTGKVLLYLLLTVAPFAVIAPLVGPALDRLQHGRRLALAASSVGRSALAVVMALNFDSWIIYPCALGMLVLSKGFGVLKAALAPRVLPPSITLVKTNSRMSVFGLIAGAISGGIAAGIAALTDSSGALYFTAACGLVGAWLCMRIPSWVESTAGELPIHHTGAIRRPKAGDKQRGLPREVAATLWASSTIRISTGFLALFAAFVIKIRYHHAPGGPTPGMAIGASGDEQGWTQLLLLGAIGAAGGIGGFVGNALGARLPLRAPQTVALGCLAAVVGSVVVAFIIPGLITTGVVAFVASTASSLAKVCLDATLQQQLPEASRASAFGRSESVLQLSWVFGGVIGLLIGGVWALGGNAVFLVGFGIVGLLLIAGLAQSIAVGTGRTLIPELPLPWRRGAGNASAAQPGAAQPRATQPGPAQPGGPRKTPRAPSNATGKPRRTRKVNG